MGRPHIKREVEHPPVWQHFMPERRLSRGCVVLHLDEYEAVRLSDYLGFSHEEAAKKMGISRSTFTRLIGSAHRKIGEAVTLGKEIFVHGGNVRFRKDILHCGACGNTIPSTFGVPVPESCPECGEKRLYSLGRMFQHKGRWKRRKGGFDAGNQEES